MSLPNLQSILLSKRWFGFDLDDTLHEFRKASTEASQSVFEAIQIKFGFEVDTLKTSYRDILRETTANAFTDGRTSSDYRRERFTRLLQAQGIAVDERHREFLNHLLEVYTSSLRSSLVLKTGALSLIQTLWRLEKKVIVVTEGPADAQKWTVGELGLEPYIDVLVTTNEIGKSKTDGLFGVVLEKYGITADEIVYFGDNELRDVQAAQHEGILSVFYAEQQESSFKDFRELKINSWPALQSMLVQDR